MPTLHQGDRRPIRYHHQQFNYKLTSIAVPVTIVLHYIMFIIRFSMGIGLYQLLVPFISLNDNLVLF